MSDNDNDNDDRNIIKVDANCSQIIKSTKFFIFYSATWLAMELNGKGYLGVS